MALTSRAISISCVLKCRSRSRLRNLSRWRRQPRPQADHTISLPPLEAEISSASSLNLENRHSHGLDQFCASLEERPGLSILDLAGANQSTVSFVTNYGHRLYSDDFVHQMDDCFGDGEFYANQSNPLMSGKFLDAALGFSDGIFDGVLVWDTLQFLSTPLLQTVVSKLYRVLRPGSAMLAFFHAE